MPIVNYFLLKEDGGFLLLESGGRIIIDSVEIEGPEVWPSTPDDHYAIAASKDVVKIKHTLRRDSRRR